MNEPKEIEPACGDDGMNGFFDRAPRVRADDVRSTRSSDLPERAGPARLRSRASLALKVFTLAVALGLLGRALAVADLSSAFDRAARIGPALALAFLPFPAGLLLESAAWAGLFRRVGHDVSVPRLFRVRLATEALTLGLPSGGLFAEAAGPVLLAPDPPVIFSLATAATKRVLVIRTHGLFVLAGVAIAFPALAAASPALPWSIGAGGIALLLGSYGLARVLVRAGLGGRFRRVLERVRGSRMVRGGPWERRLNMLGDVPFERVDAELRVSSARSDLTATALLFAQWLLEAVGSFVLLRQLGAPIGFAAIVAVEGASTLVRALAAFAPAGVGFQDLGYLALFAALGLPELAVLGPAFLGLKRLRELAFVALGIALLATHRAPAEAAR